MGKGVNINNREEKLHARKLNKTPNITNKIQTGHICPKE